MLADKHRARALANEQTIVDLGDWDPTFVESVARDGFLLWARGPLPACLAPVEKRSPQAASSVEKAP